MPQEDRAPHSRSRGCLVAAGMLWAVLTCSCLLGAVQLQSNRLPVTFALNIGQDAQLRAGGVMTPCLRLPLPDCDQPFYIVELIVLETRGYHVYTFMRLPLKSGSVPIPSQWIQQG
jgi:hypothetical protein